MPVSEDEFERPMQMGTNQSAMSKAEQRKSNKPIMEKRRRARINHCLNELKTLILDAMKKDPARHSKLEKADILEMTVKHLQQIQRQQLATAVATDPAVIMRFKSGFDECAAEVSRYISRLEGVDNGVKQRLTAHLHRCVSSIQQISSFPHQNLFSSLTPNCDKSALILPNISSLPGDVNNNSNQNGERIQIPSGLHLIPSRLPTGELALLVPNSNHISTFLNATPGATFQFPHNTNITMNSLLSPMGGSLNTNSNHTSAFTAVTKNQEYPSPTSTADLVKKETNAPELDEFKPTPYLNGSNEQSYIQTFKTCKTNDYEESFKNGSMTKNLGEPLHKYGKFKAYGVKSEGDGFDQKAAQRPSSSSFQRTVADSTTSFLQPKETEVQENGFKPFQVEIPNTQLKAHISISENVESVKPSLPIQQKPNPNFTLNPNRKSPQRFVRTVGGLNSMGEMSYEKFLKIEPLAAPSTSEKFEEEGNLAPSMERTVSLMRPETFQTVETSVRGIKRPRESPDVSYPTSSESPSKSPRISLNVTLTDDQSKEESFGNRCKRISVIVEDSSKRDNKNEVTVNVSSQKDMWRPW